MDIARLVCKFDGKRCYTALAVFAVILLTLIVLLVVEKKGVEER
jgi:hypothetical protein